MNASGLPAERPWRPEPDLCPQAVFQLRGPPYQSHLKEITQKAFGLIERLFSDAV